MNNIFKVGDKVRRLGHDYKRKNIIGKVIKEGHNYITVRWDIKQTKGLGWPYVAYEYTIEQQKNLLELANGGIITLSPGEIWLPGTATEVKEEPKQCVIHDWHDVVLFRSTVTECKKCGKLKE